MFVIFVCPIFSPAATQMIEAALNVPHVRLGVIAQQPLAALAPKVAARLAKYYTVAEAEEVAQFYGSPLGKKFLKAVSESMSFDTMCQ
mgnify:CR=1 FL=1